MAAGFSMRRVVSVMPSVWSVSGWALTGSAKGPDASSRSRENIDGEFDQVFGHFTTIVVKCPFRVRVSVLV